MSITIDITKSVSIGAAEPSVHVAVTSLNATSGEMPFVLALTKTVEDFARTFNARKEGK